MSERLHNSDAKLVERVYSKFELLLRGAVFPAEKGWEAESDFLYLKAVATPVSTGSALRFELRSKSALKLDEVTEEALWLMLLDSDPEISRYGAHHLEAAIDPLPSQMDFEQIFVTLSISNNSLIEQTREIHFDRNGDSKGQILVPHGALCLLAVAANKSPSNQPEPPTAANDALAPAGAEGKPPHATDGEFDLRDWIAVWPRIILTRPRRAVYGVAVACLMMLLMIVFISQYGARPAFQVTGSAIALVTRGAENLPNDHLLHGDFATEFDFAAETVKLRFPGDILYSGGFAAAPGATSALDPQEYFAFEVHRVGSPAGATNSWKGRIILQQKSDARPLAGQTPTKPLPKLQSLRLEFTSVDGVALPEPLVRRIKLK